MRNDMTIETLLSLLNPVVPEGTFGDLKIGDTFTIVAAKDPFYSGVKVSESSARIIPLDVEQPGITPNAPVYNINVFPAENPGVLDAKVDQILGDVID